MNGSKKTDMRFLIFVFVLGFGLQMSAFASEISKADILATVRHMEALAKDQKSQLLKAQDDFAQQGNALNEQKLLVSKFHAQAHENAKERDVMIVVAACFVSLYFGSMVAGMVLRELPMPWSVIGAGAIYLLIFWLAYAAGRLFLHSLAQLFP